MIKATQADVGRHVVYVDCAELPRPTIEAGRIRRVNEGGAVFVAFAQQGDVPPAVQACESRSLYWLDELALLGLASKQSARTHSDAWETDRRLAARILQMVEAEREMVAAAEAVLKEAAHQGCLSAQTACRLGVAAAAMKERHS